MMKCSSVSLFAHKPARLCLIEKCVRAVLCVGAAAAVIGAAEAFGGTQTDVSQQLLKR